jgi:hypothetical protein
MHLRLVIPILAVVLIVAAAALYLLHPNTVITYNESMTWNEGSLDINLRNETSKVLHVAISTAYFTTMSIDVEPKGILREFPVENLFVDEVTDVLVVCDGFGDEKIYNAKVTIGGER